MSGSLTERFVCALSQRTECSVMSLKKKCHLAELMADKFRARGRNLLGATFSQPVKATATGGYEAESTVAGFKWNE